MTDEQSYASWRALSMALKSAAQRRAQEEQSELDDIAHRLNTRPRKTLGYRTPLEATRQGVALTN